MENSWNMFETIGHIAVGDVLYSLKTVKYCLKMYEVGKESIMS